MLSRVRTAGVNTRGGRVLDYPGQVHTLEVAIEGNARTAQTLAKRIADTTDFDLVTVYDQEGTGHTATTKACWKGYERTPGSPPNSRAPGSCRKKKKEKSSRQAASEETLVKALQKCWDQIQEQLDDEFLGMELEAPTVREIVNDQANEVLEPARLQDWEDLEAEAKTRVLVKAFPNDAAFTVGRVVKHHLMTTRGANRIADEHHDPTNFQPEDEMPNLECFSSGTSLNDLFTEPVEIGQEDGDFEILMGR
jgi:hypothetical protein